MTGRLEHQVCKLNEEEKARKHAGQVLFLDAEITVDDYGRPRGGSESQEVKSQKAHWGGAGWTGDNGNGEVEEDSNAGLFRRGQGVGRSRLESSEVSRTHSLHMSSPVHRGRKYPQAIPIIRAFTSNMPLCNTRIGVEGGGIGKVESSVSQCT